MPTFNALIIGHFRNQTNCRIPHYVTAYPPNNQHAKQLQHLTIAALRQRNDVLRQPPMLTILIWNGRSTRPVHQPHLPTLPLPFHLSLLPVQQQLPGHHQVMHHASEEPLGTLGNSHAGPLGGRTTRPLYRSATLPPESLSVSPEVPRWSRICTP